MKEYLLMVEYPITGKACDRQGKYIYSRKAISDWRLKQIEEEKNEIPVIDEFKGYSYTRIAKECLNLRTEFSDPIRYFKGWFILGTMDVLWNGNRIMTLNELIEMREEEKKQLLEWDKEGEKWGHGDRWKAYREKQARGINQAIERCIWTQEQVDEAAARITDEKVRRQSVNFKFKEGTIPRLIIDKLKKGPARYTDLQIYVDDMRGPESWVSNHTMAAVLARLRVNGYIKQEKRGAKYELA